MKYPVGTRLEYLFPEDRMYANPPWKSCVVVGESSLGNIVVESDNSDIFQVKDPDLLRPRKTRTEWWSQVSINLAGVPYAHPFVTDPKHLNVLPEGCTWHGEAFSIIVETEVPNGQL